MLKYTVVGGAILGFWLFCGFLLFVGDFWCWLILGLIDLKFFSGEG